MLDQDKRTEYQKFQEVQRLKEVHAAERKALWTSVVVAVARANDCKKSDTAIIWADNIVKAFDNRFKPD